MRKLLPVILSLMGLVAGIGAGKILQPEPVAENTLGPCGDIASHDAADHTETTQIQPANLNVDFVKLNNQFVVPVVFEGKVTSLVVLSLTLEIVTGGQDQVYQLEPKLRDIFLQVLFDHANAGGFDGVFTTSRNMDLLRQALLETAQRTLGDAVSDVLIVDLVRQDV